MKHIFLSAGEPSGDLHAGNLARALRRRAPEIRLTGLGGANLRAAGVETLADPTSASVMGFAEVIRHLGRFRELLELTTRHIRSERPDAVVLVDYPGFHMRLAHRLKREMPDLPIFFYICPKFWAWNYRRVRAFGYAIDRVLCIFPFEVELLRREGVDACWVGHPLLDHLDFSGDGAAVRTEFSCPPGRTLAALFPGSRPQEIRRILPLLLTAAGRLEKSHQVQAVIGAAPGVTREQLEHLSGVRLGSIPVWTGEAQELIAASSLVLAKSGTVTLECALFGRPMVVVYRTHPVTAWLIRRVLRTRHFSLPNLLASDFATPPAPPVVPELLQEEATPERIAAEAARILDNTSYREEMTSRLLAIRTGLGEAGASDRAAEAIFFFHR